MYFTSDSFKDVVKHIKENFKDHYFICSCELDDQVMYVTEEFISSRQLNDAIYHAFLEAQNNFHNDWETVKFIMRLCGGENKKNISVKSALTKEQYDRMNELLGNTTLLEEISNNMTNELFIW